MDERLTALELARKLKVSLPWVRKWTPALPHELIGPRMVRFNLTEVEPESHPSLHSLLSRPTPFL
jgi:hypothetical protein